MENEIGRKRIENLEVIGLSKSFFGGDERPGYIFVIAELANVIAEICIPEKMWDVPDLMNRLAWDSLKKELGNQLFDYHYKKLVQAPKVC